MRMLVIALFIAGDLAGQPTPPPPPDGPKQDVSGRVLDAQTGRPVRGALVMIMQDRNELAKSYADFEGRFQIAEAPAGDWRIAIAKSGYRDLHQRIAIPAAQPLVNVEMRIHREAVITGRVVDQRNRPVAGTRLQALSHRMNFDGTVGYFNLGGDQTDDRGEFRIWRLGLGDYVLAAYPEQQPAAHGVWRFGATGGIYPNVQSIAEAEKIALAWGQVREGLDIRLGPAASTRVEGRVLTPVGQRYCEMCSVELYVDDPDSLIRLGYGPLTQQNGIVIEGLPPGRYIAHVRGFDRATSSQWNGLARFAVTPGRTETFETSLYSEASLKGRAILEDPPDDQSTPDTPPWGGGVRLMPPRERMQLGGMTRGMFANLKFSGSEAPFELKAFPGELDLRFMGSPGIYVAGMSLDGRPLESPRLSIPAEGLSGELVVRLRSDAGTLEGSIEGSSSIAVTGPGLEPLDQTVIALPVGAGAEFRERGQLLVRSGKFQQRLAPGTYEVRALESGGMAMVNPQAAILRKYTRRVEIKPNETTVVTLPAIPAP